MDFTLDFPLERSSTVSCLTMDHNARQKSCIGHHSRRRSVFKTLGLAVGAAAGSTAAVTACIEMPMSSEGHGVFAGAEDTMNMSSTRGPEPGSNQENMTKKRRLSRLTELKAEGVLSETNLQREQQAAMMRNAYTEAETLCSEEQQNAENLQREQQAAMMRNAYTEAEITNKPMTTVRFVETGCCGNNFTEHPLKSQKSLNEHQEESRRTLTPLTEHPLESLPVYSRTLNQLKSYAARASTNLKGTLASLVERPLKSLRVNTNQVTSAYLPLTMS